MRVERNHSRGTRSGGTRALDCGVLVKKPLDAAEPRDETRKLNLQYERRGHFQHRHRHDEPVPDREQPRMLPLPRIADVDRFGTCASTRTTAMTAHEVRANDFVDAIVATFLSMA
jgi:hypothetical protein